MTMKFPIDTCDKCHKTYVACRTCGHYTFDMRQEGEKCRCNLGTFEKTESVICCQRHHHHLHNRCDHCGQMG